jgi:alkanesulfonate monooxygenase SsuD/methylene tetrahydromethanopterin reductase-like flavin-dependent oxidoreductase (luciferase family)
VDDNAARARDRINAAMTRIYGRRVPEIEAAAIAGTAADCAAQVALVADAGAGLVLFTTVFDQAEQAERLAGEVIPRLG